MHEKEIKEIIRLFFGKRFSKDIQLRFRYMVSERYLHQSSDQLNYIFHIPLVYYTHNLYICAVFIHDYIVLFKIPFHVTGDSVAYSAENYHSFYTC